MDFQPDRMIGSLMIKLRGGTSGRHLHPRFETIGSGNVDFRSIGSARLMKDRYTPHSELKASVVLNNSINLNNIRRVAL